VAGPSAGPAAGWYDSPDAGPDAKGMLRWWDGRSWTPYTTPSPDGAAREPQTTLPLVAAVGALVVLAASLLGSRLLLASIVELDWPIVAYVVISGLLGYGPAAAWCWYVSRRWGEGRLAADVGLRVRWSDLGWGPLTWIAAVTAQVAVAAFILALDIPLISNTEGIDNLDADRGYVISLLVLAVVAAPIVEELVFRGVVLRGLLGVMPVTVAIGLQGVLFGAAHVDPVRGVGNIGLVMVLSAVGVVLGGAAYLLRRLGPVMIAHAIFNGVVMLIVLTGVADRL
jgi:membrane protease YdiL (CAAX protease family)